MTRRNALIAVVLLLVVLNVLRWTGSEETAVEKLPTQTALSIVDATGLGEKASEDDVPDGARDIFSYAITVEPTSERLRKDAEEAQKMASEREERRQSERPSSPQDVLRYAGMAKRNGVAMAYVLLNERPSIVRVGDILDGRYRVVNVTANELKFTDVSTKSVYRISIGNKFE